MWFYFALKFFSNEEKAKYCANEASVQFSSWKHISENNWWPSFPESLTCHEHRRRNCICIASPHTHFLGFIVRWGNSRERRAIGIIWWGGGGVTRWEGWKVGGAGGRCLVSDWLSKRFQWDNERQTDQFCAPPSCVGAVRMPLGWRRLALPQCEEKFESGMSHTGGLKTHLFCYWRISYFQQ